MSLSVKNENERLAIRISVITIVINLTLTLFKLAAGIIGHSEAMLSDAVHTASDVLTTIIVIIGVRLSNREIDSGHQYGHERFECVAALLLSIVLFATGAGIGWSGVRSVYTQSYQTADLPGVVALVAAVASIAVKEAMYWYTRAGAKKIRSGALMADAWHHRSDALSSIGSFAAILGSRLGLPILDPIGGVIICVFILKASVDIFLDSIGKMTDKACDTTTASRLRDLILSEAGVAALDVFRTRIFGDKIFVDIEISVDGNLTLFESHAIAQSIHDKVERQFSEVKHCMVHVNPARPEAGS